MVTAFGLLLLSPALDSVFQFNSSEFVCGSKDAWYTPMVDPKWSASIDMMKTIRDAEQPSRPEDHLGIIAPQPTTPALASAGGA